MPNTPHNSSRLSGLDGLRVIAIILVLLGHFIPQIPLIENGLGQFGVDIFFVLSGFLITYLIFKDEVKQGYFAIKKFYLRRAIRILPPLYFYLIVITILAILGVIKLYPNDLIGGIFFIRNYIPNTFATETSHL